MCAALALLAGGPFGARAEDALLKAGVVIRTVDLLSERCARQGGFKPAQSTAVATWARDNRIDALRTRIAALEAARRRQIDPAATAVVQRLGALASDGCAAAVAATRAPDAQLAALAPAPAPAAAAAPAPAVVAAEPVRADPALLAQIEGFGFDTRAAMGIGGFITTEVYPVVLFRDGRLLKDVEALLHPGGLAAHRAAQPKDWSRWRRGGGELQIERGSAWEKLAFQTVYARLPDSFRLAGLYRRLGGGGNVGVGGTDSVAAWNEYRFGADGRVSRGGGAGARAETGGGSVATAQRTAGRSGTYRVDGLVLKIRYDDGGEESRILITDPKDPTGAIWLDGRGYVQRKG